jgi:3-methylfumaryl-CoA hydratase
MDIDTALLQSWIGRTAEAEDVITQRLADEFVATFAPHIPKDSAAPLGIHWCLSPAIAPGDALGADGHPPKGGFLPPVPLPRRMWAGGEVETLGELRVGDHVTRRSTIADVSLKSGRTGPLCFVAVRHEYSTERGLAVRERHDIVYREAATGAGQGSPAAERRPADLSWTVETGPVLLFRYSAITFNGHRIHYDLPYVTEVEGYAGLVVHGPIQATLLLNMAARLAGAPPPRFNYRGQSPLIAGKPFQVAGARGRDGELSCWTQSEEGAICMQGSVPQH